MRRGALGTGEDSTRLDVASWPGEKEAGLPVLFVLLRYENTVFSLLWTLETGLTGACVGFLRQQPSLGGTGGPEGPSPLHSQT